MELATQVFNHLTSPEKVDFGRYVSAETQREVEDVYTRTVLAYPVAIPAVTLSVYLLFVFLGPAAVRASGVKLELKWPMALWNLFLSVLSGCFVVRVASLTLPVLLRDGLLHCLCIPQPRYLWTDEAYAIVFLFALSKYMELVDTVFLVLRGRDVMFLHWYHHTTVLLYTWFSLITGHAAGWLFGMVNGFVHVVMYFYYFYSGVTGTKPFWGKYITQLQLAQMVGGIILTAVWDYFYLTGEDCPASHPVAGMVSSAAMYVSYLYLFLGFYSRRHSKAVAGKKKRKKVA